VLLDCIPFMRRPHYCAGIDHDPLEARRHSRCTLPGDPRLAYDADGGSRCLSRYRSFLVDLAFFMAMGTETEFLVSTIRAHLTYKSAHKLEEQKCLPLMVTRTVLHKIIKLENYELN
jgi:hypothetical protein